MPTREKFSILRARAVRLRERARALENAFTDAAMKACIASIILGIDDTLAWLDARGDDDHLPKVDALLPGTTSAVSLLEDVLRHHGRNRELRAMVTAMPGLARALDDVAAEKAARRA